MSDERYQCTPAIGKVSALLHFEKCSKQHRDVSQHVESWISTRLLDAKELQLKALETTLGVQFKGAKQGGRSGRKQVVVLAALSGFLDERPAPELHAKLLEFGMQGLTTPKDTEMDMLRADFEAEAKKTRAAQAALEEATAQVYICICTVYI